MGTRSDIIAKLADDKWARIYCHWDGYLSHNGQILFDHYTGPEKVAALIALGDLSSLGAEIGVKHPFEKPALSICKGKEWVDNPAYEKFNKKYGAMCTAYGRDRGEKNVGARYADSIHAVWPEADTWTEFTYVWDGERWWVGDPDEGTQSMIDLGDALMGKKLLRPAIKCPWGVLGKHSGEVGLKPPATA